MAKTHEPVPQKIDTRDIFDKALDAAPYVGGVAAGAIGGRAFTRKMARDLGKQHMTRFKEDPQFRQDVGSPAWYNRDVDVPNFQKRLDGVVNKTGRSGAIIGAGFGAAGGLMYAASGKKKKGRNK